MHHETRLHTTVLHGTALHLRWKHPEIGSIVAEVLSHVGFQGDSATNGVDGLTLTLAVAEPRLPAESREMTRFESGIRAWRAGGELFLGDPDLLMRLASSGARAEVAPALLGEPEVLRPKLFGLIMLGLLVLLRRRRLYPLHAAALERGGAGLLLIGASDVGKSTLSYSLVREGWRYVSDDAVLLRSREGHVEVLQFRRHFGLDVEAGRIFPELAAGWEAQVADKAKWRVPVEKLFPAGAAAQCRPRVLVFPEITERPTSRIEEVERGEAMRRVARESALLTLEPEGAPAHLEALKQLICQTRHYRLFAGCDLKEDPARAADMLEGLLPPSLSAPFPHHTSTRDLEPHG